MQGKVSDPAVGFELAILVPGSLLLVQRFGLKSAGYPREYSGADSGFTKGKKGVFRNSYWRLKAPPLKTVFITIEGPQHLVAIKGLVGGVKSLSNLIRRCITE